MIPNNSRKQVARNTVALGKVSDRFNPVFARKSDTALGTVPDTVIFQVLSEARPTNFVADFGSTIIEQRAGIYNCVEMVLNNEESSGINAWDGNNNYVDKLTDKQGATAIVDGTDAASTYTEWSGTTSYLIGDVVQINTEFTLDTTKKLTTIRIFKAIKDNLKKPPESNPEEWTELTVEVLNIPESMGNKWPAVVRRAAKVAKWDRIIANRYTDNTGISRWAGHDTAGNTRIFKLTGDTESSYPLASILIKNTWIGHSGSTNIYAEEGGINYAEQIVDFQGNNLWDFDSSDEFHVTATWSDGMWMRTQELSMLRPIHGIKYTALGIEADIDGTTIGLNGSDQLEVI